MNTLLDEKTPYFIEQFFKNIVQNTTLFNEQQFKEEVLPHFEKIKDASVFFGFKEENYANNLKLRAFENLKAGATDLFIAFVHFHENQEFSKKPKKIDTIYQKILDMVSSTYSHNNGEVLFKYKKIEEKVSKNFPLFIYDLEATCLKNKKQKLMTENEALILMELDLKYNMSYFIEDLDIDNTTLNNSIKKYNEKNKDGSMLNQYISSKSRGLYTLSRLDNYYHQLSQNDFVNQLKEINNYALLNYLFKPSDNKKSSAMFKKNLPLSQKIFENIEPSKIIKYFKEEEVIKKMIDWSNPQNEKFMITQMKRLNTPLIISPPEVVIYLDKMMQKQTHKVLSYFLEEISKKSNKDELLEEMRSMKRFQKNETLHVYLEKLSIENQLNMEEFKPNKNKIKI